MKLFFKEKFSLVLTAGVLFACKLVSGKAKEKSIQTVYGNFKQLFSSNRGQDPQDQKMLTLLTLMNTLDLFGP